MNNKIHRVRVGRESNGQSNAVYHRFESSPWVVKEHLPVKAFIFPLELDVGKGWRRSLKLEQRKALESLPRVHKDKTLHKAEAIAPT